MIDGAIFGLKFNVLKIGTFSKYWNIPPPCILFCWTLGYFYMNCGLTSFPRTCPSKIPLWEFCTCTKYLEHPSALHPFLPDSRLFSAESRTHIRSFAHVLLRLHLWWSARRTRKNQRLGNRWF